MGPRKRRKMYVKSRHRKFPSKVDLHGQSDRLKPIQRQVQLPAMRDETLAVHLPENCLAQR